MASGEGDQRRYPRNIQGILQMAVDHSDDPATSTSSVFQEMSEEVNINCMINDCRSIHRVDDLRILVFK